MQDGTRPSGTGLFCWRTERASQNVALGLVVLCGGARSDERKRTSGQPYITHSKALQVEKDP